MTPLRVLQITGAGLFLVSLGWGGKAYFESFDRVAPAGTGVWPPLLTDVGLFSAFALHHSMLARTSLKRRLQARVGPEAERSLYVIIASVLYLLCCLAWRPLPGTWYAATGLLWWVGAAVQGMGVAVTLLAARTLNLEELMGLEAPRRRVAHDQPAPLETRGLYGVVRHPIYLGWVLFVFGAPVMTSTRLTFALVSTFYVVLAIPLEERGLVETFGESYRRYQRMVRWRVLPGVY